MSSALIFILLASFSSVLADPATLPFTDCFSSTGNTSQKFSVSTVYGQVLQSDLPTAYLNLTVLGTTPEPIENSANGSGNLATLFTTTSVLTLNAWSNATQLCASLRPPSPLPDVESNSSAEDAYYCPIDTGSFAFSSQIPWGNHRALTTLTTRLSAVDPFSHELVCIDVNTTPLSPSRDNPYGVAIAIFWASVALAIAYWLLVGVARIVSAWDRGITRPDKNLWARAQSAGFILASAISGERLATSPALLRFCTPSMRDIIFHTQWCAVLAMVAVQWPDFVYPLLTQTAWSTLSYNITITSPSTPHRWDPLSTAPYNPPDDFSDQLSSSSSALFIDPNAPNVLFTLPENATSGISSFAYTIGVRPQDLFGICLTLFLGIVAASISLSVVVWFIDYLACLIVGMLNSDSASSGPGKKLSGTRSPGYTSKDLLDGVNNTNLEESKSLNGRDIIRPPSRFGFGGASIAGRKWWRIRSSSQDLSSFHGSVLHGNLVRILVLFHLPVTIFSSYQMTLPRDQASLASIILAAISFALFSFIIPLILVIRVRLTTTNKLYEETRTLLSLGPLYNHYRHGSQMFASLLFATNLALGITVGAGQRSGTAQAIVILVIEVVCALVTSVWLPWGTGASMGLISFLFCVARIVIAVLLVILTPAISIGSGAGGWVAYGILVILALIYLAQALMLVIKLIEAAVRIVGGVGFDRSRHVVDSGLLGACGLVGCCGSRSKSHRSRKHGRPGNAASKTAYRPANSASGRSPTSQDSDVSSYIPPMMLGAMPLGDSKKGSIHSSGPPPSVLKPEHALRPYREESDDENGFIMGAWQPFQQPFGARSSGYIPVDDPPVAATSNTPIKSSSGFSRVGGGRAHIDSPYAITQGSGSTQSMVFPSIGHRAAASGGRSSSSTPVSVAAARGAGIINSSATLPRVDHDESPPPSVSSNVALGQRQYYSEARTERTSLPPGAMPPFHVRTKSQTAIIEHAGISDLPTPMSKTHRQGGSSSSHMTATPANVGGSRPPSGANAASASAAVAATASNVPPTSYRRRSTAESDDESSYVGRSKKKPWYHLRRHRPHSSEGYSSSPTTAGPTPDEEAAIGLTPGLDIPAPSTTAPGRSFVVIRKPQASPARSSQVVSGPGSGSGNGSSTPTPTAVSFARDN